MTACLAPPAFHANCRFSYKGLGEPLCFWAFGPLATTAFYLACSAGAATAAATADASAVLAGVSNLVLLLSVIVGITTTVILFCSHWHQIQGDIAAGKMSPLVRLGTANACKVGGGPLVCSAASVCLAAACAWACMCLHVGMTYLPASGCAHIQ